MANIKIFAHDRIKTKHTTLRIMIELSIALAALLLASIIYYGVTGGSDAGKYILRIILNLLVAFITAYACEFVNVVIRQRKDLKVKDWFLYPITHSFFFVTPLIVLLLFPVYTPIYVVFVAVLIGEIVAKLLFGGFGQNIFNPALVGRVFAEICFSGQIKQASVINYSDSLTISSGATINTINQTNGFLTNVDISLGNLFIGNYHGALGETFAIVLIVLGIYLAIRKIIDYRISLAYVLTFFIISLFIGIVGDKGIGSFEFALRQVLYGAVLFGAVFCITDPVTTPVSCTGKIIAAILGATVSAAIRYLGASVEGVAYSILMINLITPAIDKLLSHKSNHKLVVQYSIIGGLLVIAIGLGCGIGAYLSGKMGSIAPNINLITSTLPLIKEVF